MVPIKVLEPLISMGAEGGRSDVTLAMGGIVAVIVVELEFAAKAETVPKRTRTRRTNDNFFIIFPQTNFI